MQIQLLKISSAIVWSFQFLQTSCSRLILKVNYFEGTIVITAAEVTARFFLAIKSVASSSYAPLLIKSCWINSSGWDFSRGDIYIGIPMQWNLKGKLAMLLHPCLLYACFAKSVYKSRHPRRIVVLWKKKHGPMISAFLGPFGDHSKRLTGSICHLFNYQKESYITQITYFGFI